jgi:hypothetical protein
MDKDLKDAVLAAFDGEPEDDKQAAGPAEEGAAEEVAEGDQEGTVAAGGPKAGAPRRKAVAASGPIRRAAPAAPAPGRRPGAALAETTPAVAAAARPKTNVAFPAETGDSARPAARPYAGPVAAATPAAKRSPLGVLSLLLTVVLAVLVIVLLVQVAGLKEEIRRQEALVREIKNLSRVTVSVYQEPGKRAQQVIAGHDVDADGKVKIGKMIIQPLPEE